MFTSLDVSLVRERNGRLLREVQAYRLGGGSRARRGRRTGSSWRTVGASVARAFASPFARPGRTGRKGVGLGDA